MYNWLYDKKNVGQFKFFKKKRRQLDKNKVNLNDRALCHLHYARNGLFS